VADRDKGGRFAKGHKQPGPGNPAARHARALANAARAAIEPDELRGVLRTLLGLARAGDTAAAKLLLDRTLGRSREEPSATALDLGPLESAADLPLALQRIGAAMARGEVSPSEAAQSVQLVDALGAALERAALEVRIARLEERNNIRNP
jgi:hypothetical protein